MKMPRGVSPTLIICEGQPKKNGMSTPLEIYIYFKLFTSDRIF